MAHKIAIFSFEISRTILFLTFPLAVYRTFPVVLNTSSRQPSKVHAGGFPNIHHLGWPSETGRFVMLKAGQVLYDNDPRYRGRTIEVLRVDGPYAICKSIARQQKVRLDYIFSDGEPRRSGYSTIAPVRGVD
jgi:hypothetical protein